MLPFWALVSFGAYLLGTLGWGVLTFKDTEDAYKELVEVSGYTGRSRLWEGYEDGLLTSCTGDQGGEGRAEEEGR